MPIVASESWERLREEVRRIAHERMERDEATRFLEGLDAFLARAAPDELAAMGAEGVYGAALSLWRFAGERPPGTARLRVYNPAMAEHGWSTTHTVIEIVNDDMPFLVDSLTVALTDAGLGIHVLVHPLVRVRRDGAGRRLALLGPDDDGAGRGVSSGHPAKGDGAPASAEDGGALRESVIQAQIDRLGDEAALASLEATLSAMLGHVRAAVGDWRAMLAELAEATGGLRTRAPAALAEDAAEAADFLDWLADHHFTFLGSRRFSVARDGSVAPVAPQGLGLLADPDFTFMRDRNGDYAHWTESMAEHRAEAEPVMILKANRRSDVHRGTHFDVVAVADYDDDGRHTGDRLFVGLFTSAAYNRSPHSIPLLREKVERVIARAGFRPASHDGKALANVLETYPRDELFQASEAQLLENAVGILQLVTRPRTRLFTRPDRFARFVSCIVFVPRERYSTELRVRLGDVLCQRLDGRVASWEPSFDMEALARVHFVIALNARAVPDVDVASLEREIKEATRSWTDRLGEALIEREGEHAGRRLARRFARAFPAGYREDVPVQVAVGDVARIEPLTDAAPLALYFYRRLEDDERTVRFKLYRRGAPVELSECLPVLEHMGFRVLAEHPYRVDLDAETWVHDFEMRSLGGIAVDLSGLRAKLEDAFAAVWARRVDDDPLNRLVLLAGLDVRQVTILRAYSRFLRQARVAYSISYMEDALAETPKVAADLVALFAARFGPAEGGREGAQARLVGRIEDALDAVESLDVDRILRRFLNAIQATLRTNAYRADAEGRPLDYLSFKFDCAALEELPEPRPWREIFVYAPWVEGVHLRGGPIARGGLRWSDRREDYRTEVLGLVKAQQVKNAVIVPVGSKGGFLPKSLPAGGTREEVQAEAVRCYETFLAGMLDVTDNLVDGSVVAPEDVVRHDGDDPYLVVAADKGTATFSDYANALARARGFWLDDAFASGGSNGYDHKGMGITARGAWEAVKRHFRELGHDTQSEPFSVIGCGDMSGDVFGNGMLLSEQIRLVAAFDHRDVFIDPDPDPGPSFAERRRLFAMGRSSWRDYDESLISKGGGVFARHAKSVTLTPEIKRLTGLSEDRVAPARLIRALIAAPCDLFWFGGIGTYVKSAQETHIDVGDRANDAVRIDAGDMRARVVGEGANLGITQRARIALARRGVKINTDAVDNSAGVDCSDHEVNIKIALGSVVASGDMTMKQRNALLAEMTEDVARLVLRTNYAQTRAISMTEARAPMLRDEHVRLMRALEAEGRLDRAVEVLPDEETLAERRDAGEGLARPELAVLLAYAKIVLFDEVLATSVPDDAHVGRFLMDYMPDALSGRFPEAVRGHRLSREIVATVLANLCLDECGIAFVHRTREETGASVGEIVEAFVVAREILAVAELRAEIDALDTRIDAGVQTEMHWWLADAIAVQAGGLLNRPAALDAAKLIETYGPGTRTIAASVEAMLSDFSKSRYEERVERLSAAGVPDALARRVSALEFIGGALDMVDAAEAQGRDIEAVARTYFAAGARFGLDWLRATARGLESADHWESLAVGRLIGDLRAQQGAIAAAALARGEGTEGARCVETWAEAKAEEARRADRLVAEMQSGGPLTVSKLAVAASQLRTMVSG